MNTHTLQNGTEIFNATPHPITFWMEEWKQPEVVPSHSVINASVVENLVATVDSIEYVETKFENTNEGKSLIAQVNRENPGAIIVGSIIAAQAYPGDVVSMVPCAGFERVPPSEKRMRPNKFTLYGEKEFPITRQVLHDARRWAYESSMTQDEYRNSCALLDRATEEIA